MPEQETIKLEIEIPKDQIHILDNASEALVPPTLSTDSEDHNKEMRIAKFKKQLAEAKSSRQDAIAANDSSRLSKMSEVAAKSPIEKLPSAKDTSPPNINQKRLITLGLIVALTGLILWPLANFIIAIAIASVGAAAVATGTFVKV